MTDAAHEHMLDVWRKVHDLGVMSAALDTRHLSAMWEQIERIRLALYGCRARYDPSFKSTGRRRSRDYQSDAATKQGDPT